MNTPFDSIGARRRMTGFSLLEVSLIILILGLLTPLVWRFIAAQGEQRIVRVNYSLLERADAALTGFAMAHDRLPCPAATNDGFENCLSGAETGYLPYRTLGLADARAGQTQYGVLRRTIPVSDPEIATNDPQPPLPRGADLAASPVDRFYPLFAYIATGASFPLSYLQTVPTLETDPDDPDPNATTGGGFMVASDNIQIGNTNTLDFCAMLRIADDPPPDPSTANMNINGKQIAYALRLPGSLPEPAADFTSPANPQNWQNNASTRVVSLATLWQRMECSGSLAAAGHAHPNAATASVMLYRGIFDIEQILQQTVELREVDVLMSQAAVTSASASVAEAIAASLHAAGDVAKTFGVAAAWAIAAAIVASVSAALELTLAGIGLDSAFEARDIAKQRYHFIQGLRASMKTLTQSITSNALNADARGVYLNQP
jgi:type II secretory pathway pseudopilin PulG